MGNPHGHRQLNWGKVGRDRPASGEAVSLGAGLFAAGKIAHADSATPTSADEKKTACALADGLAEKQDYSASSTVKVGMTPPS